MELSDRKLAIIEAIVSDFIMTGSPMGSRTLSRKFGMDLSPATLRNEMSDLEEMGYLEQPHTSAGRIPSDKAYRLYVDRLMRVPELSQEETDQIRQTYFKRSGEVEGVVRQAARAISQLTNYTSIALIPQQDVSAQIRSVQLVPVNDGVAMLVLVTDAGIYKDAMLRVPADMTPEDLFRISGMLTQHLKGRTLDEVPDVLAGEMGPEFFRNRMLFDQFVEVLESKREDPDDEVVLGGTSNLFNFPEYSDIDKARSMLAVLENKPMLHNMLHDATKLEFNVSIGGENSDESIKDCSVVTATYRIGGKAAGSIGVIGPTRMEYSKVMAILAFMGQGLSDLLSDQNGRKDEDVK